MVTIEGGYQAFPIRQDTYQGTPTDKNLIRPDGHLEYNIVHLQADATLTVGFRDGTSVSIAGLAGEDFSLARDASTITATDTVILS